MNSVTAQTCLYMGVNTTDSYKCLVSQLCFHIKCLYSQCSGHFGQVYNRSSTSSDFWTIYPWLYLFYYFQVSFLVLNIFMLPSS